MVSKNSRPTVGDIRAMKARGQKISMLYVTTLDEAAAAAAAGIDILSIEGRFFSPEMRQAAGNCFVQVGLPYGAAGNLVTAEDYLREAFRCTGMGGDCFYCAASLDIQKTLCDNAVPVVAHVGLIPSQCTWTGGFKAVGKTAESARAVWDHVKRLEAIGCFGAELEVVPDRVAEAISRSTPLIMLGMGAGPGADAQYLFAEDVLGHTAGHKPRHAKTYRNFAAEFDRLQHERIAAFREFFSDVATGVYPAPQHVVPMDDAEYERFLAGIRS
ncbi:3-methyl-2-oxobutanoate hydroxymethyltransferase [Mesorhizobium sp. LCM 4577]|uniref:3-methyl-2-oxobutanoate hydroxymethyltransferase n=1 Tax=Mesorhizobium plurifarium TaxID=69974 RepID=A0A090DFC7_MESPL|nr:3-methyl-2-oxobutanoate hydroxymethyltransferase [Mesorhizobium sp. LCM 4577]OHV62676.1 3-methyl-2-oxobutanoate hydroxymethyltransferase [Mesorhizobium sp. LCM 4577]CDX12230.1 3-methyl-2-oxobutanoate hydroxymethyltransferase [Mesorhizobium plurifarium]CDX37954.1 3-methyl-2-oxobutanoate hydroxymethyltransferase [Mesorhizobium sp. ORS 3359]